MVIPDCRSQIVILLKTNIYSSFLLYQKDQAGN